ncbi:hypothetical protein EDD86DRAFT_243713 [Gorgonomyces haynaldii]|nr:hypothetical protein EDD86DRAFT_243713 [Gorgonomyces haynaldii]
MSSTTLHETDETPLSQLYPNAVENQQRRATILFLQSLHARQPSNETLPPPWSESEPPPPYTPRKEKSSRSWTRNTALCLVLVFMVVLTSLTTGSFNLVIITISFIYLTMSLFGNASFLKQDTNGMILSTILYLLRWIADFTTVIFCFYAEAKVNLSMFTIMFTTPMLGNQDFYAENRYCPDRLMVASKPFNALFVQAGVLLPHFCFLVLLYIVAFRRYSQSSGMA